jgi:hypothetical protein
VTQTQGLFCANFGAVRLELPTCQNAWCPSCYKTLPGVDFLIYRQVDEDGQELLAPGEEHDFKQARAGDHLFCPFECDYCTFYKLKGANPDANSHLDSILLAYIRRANLDAFWCRRPSTVNALRRLFVEQMETGEFFGFQMFEPLGPFRPGYDSGMKAALGLLRKGQTAGRHESHAKFSTVRKARAVHTNVYSALARGIHGALVWRSEKNCFVATDSPMDSTWFVNFMAGLKARVGERRRQDAAISIGVMILKQQLLEAEWTEALESGNINAQLDVAEHATFFLFLYCGSLRGFEGPKVLLTDLRRQIVSPGSPAALHTPPHVGIPLSGCFKARTQEQRHILIPVAYETASGLCLGKWAERLIQCLETWGITTGWLFRGGNGAQKPMHYFEERFYDLLLRVQQIDASLFPEGIDVVEDFHLGRSHHRGATTRATEAGVSQRDIKWINRWNIGEEQTGSVPMSVLYADRAQMMTTFLRFSAAL